MKKKLLIIVILLLCITACGKKEPVMPNDSEGGNNATETVSKITSDIFTSRELEQTVDTSDATKYTVSDNKNITISKTGTYVITGTAKNVSIIIGVDKTEKVQLVLENLSITNESLPCIYVTQADKVYINLKKDNSLSVTSEFTSMNNTNTDAVIFSEDDLVINGTGSLTLSSTENGITSKDNLKITGGTINIDCEKDALEAHDSIAVSDGNITINTKKDGFHAEYDKDDTVGYIYIAGGTFDITASGDGIQATTLLQIDAGTFNIYSSEGLEATEVVINDGDINIKATDDGINASNKSSSYKILVEINGGNLTITMGRGDTDGIDSNGSIIINDGTISIEGQSPFDYADEGIYNGGTIIVNGTETNAITNQFDGQEGGSGGGFDNRPGVPPGERPGDREIR